MEPHSASGDVVAEDPLSEQLFERVLSMGGDEYRRVVPAGAYPWLARVHVDKTLPSKGEDHRESAEQMLSNGVVLRYQDDAAWFDVHPVTLRIPGVEEAIQHLRGRRRQGARLVPEPGSGCSCLHEIAP